MLKKDRLRALVVTLAVVVVALAWTIFTSSGQKPSIGDHDVPGDMKCWEDEAMIVTDVGIVCKPIDNIPLEAIEP